VDTEVVTDPVAEGLVTPLMATARTSPAEVSELTEQTTVVPVETEQ
jgi:hypothetical protein